jgi:hypothetical protein
MQRAISPYVTPFALGLVATMAFNLLDSLWAGFCHTDGQPNEGNGKTVEHVELQEIPWIPFSH